MVVRNQQLLAEGSRLAWAAVAVILLVLPVVVKSEYVMRLANVAGVMVIVSVGLNLLTGLAGQVSLGHAGFVAIGAYVTGMLSTWLGMSFWTTLPVVVAVGCASGALLAMPALRTAGIYLTMVTIGFGEIVRLVLLNWMYVGGPEGIPGIPRVTLTIPGLHGEEESYYVVLLFAALSLVFMLLVMRSRFGRAFRAMRQSEIAAATLGINPYLAKLLAFSLSTGVTAVAGSLYAHVLLHVSPDMFTLDMSVTFLAMLLVGGSGTLAGPVIGAIILTVLPEILRPLKAYYLMTYGLGIMLVLVFMPDGIVGRVRHLALRFLARRTT